MRVRFPAPSCVFTRVMPATQECATQKCSSRPMLLPVILEPPVDAATTQGDDGVGAANSLEHAGSLQARSDNTLAASFHHAGANEESLAAELRIAHPTGIGGEIFGLFENLLR